MNSPGLVNRGTGHDIIPYTVSLIIKAAIKAS